MELNTFEFIQTYFIHIWSFLSFACQQQLHTPQRLF